MSFQSLYEAEKSLIDLSKCVFLVAKYNNFRTQFQTKDHSKDERKIIDYQNNFVKIINGITNVLLYKIGIREMEKNCKQLTINIDKVQKKYIESYFFIYIIYIIKIKAIIINKKLMNQYFKCFFFFNILLCIKLNIKYHKFLEFY
jgi:hypothetical protein